MELTAGGGDGGDGGEGERRKGSIVSLNRRAELMDRNSSEVGWYGPLLLDIVKETGLGCAAEVVAEAEVGVDRLELEFGGTAVDEEVGSRPWREDRGTPATFEKAHSDSGDGRVVEGGLAPQDRLGAVVRISLGPAVDEDDEEGSGDDEGRYSGAGTLEVAVGRPLS